MFVLHALHRLVKAAVHWDAVLCCRLGEPGEDRGHRHVPGGAGAAHPGLHRRAPLLQSQRLHHAPRHRPLHRSPGLPPVTELRGALAPCILHVRFIFNPETELLYVCVCFIIFFFFLLESLFY